jgi:hypothetical protein
MVSMRWDYIKLWGQKLIVAKVLEKGFFFSLCGVKSWFIKIKRIISEPLFLNYILLKPRQSTYKKSNSNITSIAPVSLSPKQVHIKNFDYIGVASCSATPHHINILARSDKINFIVLAASTPRQAKVRGLLILDMWQVLLMLKVALIF